MYKQEETMDLVHEVKRLLERHNIDPRAVAYADETQNVTSCPTCIICTCMICV